MRCHHCFRPGSESLCAHCGATTWLPPIDATTPNHDDLFLESLAAGANEGEICDLLCLAMTIQETPDASSEAHTEVAMADLRHGEQAIFGLYLARRGDEAQAAAHFAAAQEGGGTICFGDFTVDFGAVDDDGLAETRCSSDGPINGTKPDRAEPRIGKATVRVTRGDVAAEMGILDCERIAWESCQPGSVDGLFIPSEWAAWRAQLAHHSGVLRALGKIIAGRASAAPSSFRERWREFQLHLGETRDTLGVSPEHAALVDLLNTRDRAAIRGLDVSRTIAGLVESARNALRLRADSLRGPSLETELRDSFGTVFVEYGLDAMLSLRDDLRRESVSAHAEMRKALDYQSRLLRTTQEALNASLSDLARRAGGLMWRFVAQSALDEALEQSVLLLERAREVAMIEQTDAWLQNLGSAIDYVLGDMLAEITQRRGQIELACRAFDRLFATLNLPNPEGNHGMEDERECRRWVLDMPCSLEGVRALVLRATAERREMALI